MKDAGKMERAAACAAFVIAAAALTGCRTPWAAGTVEQFDPSLAREQSALVYFNAAFGFIPKLYNGAPMPEAITVKPVFGANGALSYFIPPGDAEFTGDIRMITVYQNASGQATKRDVWEVPDVSVRWDGFEAGKAYLVSMMRGGDYKLRNFTMFGIGEKVTEKDIRGTAVFMAQITEAPAVYDKNDPEKLKGISSKEEESTRVAEIIVYEMQGTR